MVINFIVFLTLAAIVIFGSIDAVRSMKITDVSKNKKVKQFELEKSPKKETV